MRFNCTCPNYSTGQRCEKLKPYHSCKDLATNGAKKSAIYLLKDFQNNIFPVYCDFVSESPYVWALIQSFSLANSNMFKDHRFGVDNPVNEDGGMINWNAYRLSLSHMQSVANGSTHLRATCNFPDDGLVYTDYARAKLEGHDLFGYWYGQCREYELLNIRGNQCQNCTARTWLPENEAWHLTSSDPGSCQFDGRSGAVGSEQNFGRYAPDRINPAFRCTSYPNSTTQHWIGSLK